MGSIFIAGTESGVGKTVVVAALSRIAVDSGVLPVVYKPFRTDDNEDITTPIAAIQDLMKGRVSGSAIMPMHCEGEYDFDSPISPYTGLRLEEEADIGGVLGSISRLRRGARSAVEEAAVSLGAPGTLMETPRGEALIVEGYGGAMTPICRDYFVADLIRDAAMPAVIVTTNRIGALGLSVMTAMSCRERGAPPAGFVVNCTDPRGHDPARLAEDIEEVAGAPVLAVIGAHGNPAPAGRRGSLFGVLPARGGPWRRREDLPESTKRSAAAAEAAHKSGALDAVARVMLGKWGGPGKGAAAAGPAAGPAAGEQGPRRREGARSVFVAGTDTGVGKTVVAGALARTAARAGCRTGVFKPFSAGGEDDVAALGAALADAQGGMGGARTKYAFGAPASPYTAARLEGADIDVGSVLEEFRRMLHEYEAVVVEGTGGAMTPILRDYFVADLARDMGVPTIIVTGNGFDAAGHSAMAAFHCRGRGAHVAGFVVNRTEADGHPMHLLRKEVSDVTGLPVLASVENMRRGAAGAGGGAAAAAAARAAIGASRRGYVDGAARVMFGKEWGGAAAARWRRQARRRREMRRRAAGGGGPA